jgi:hypothetical protein
VRYHWWGIELLLKDTDTHALLDALKAGSPAISALITAIAGPVAGVVVGSILVLGGVAINFMDQIGEHDGVIFGHLWHPFTPPWVWYQLPLFPGASMSGSASRLESWYGLRNNMSAP